MTGGDGQAEVESQGAEGNLCADDRRRDIGPGRRDRDAVPGNDDCRNSDVDRNVEYFEASSFDIAGDDVAEFAERIGDLSVAQFVGFFCLEKRPADVACEGPRSVQ